jgi:hypothetical protein
MLSNSVVYISWKRSWEVNTCQKQSRQRTTNVRHSVDIVANSKHSPHDIHTDHAQHQL